MSRRTRPTSSTKAPTPARGPPLGRSGLTRPRRPERFGGEGLGLDAAGCCPARARPVGSPGLPGSGRRLLWPPDARGRPARRASGGAAPRIVERDLQIAAGLAEVGAACPRPRDRPVDGAVHRTKIHVPVPPVTPPLLVSVPAPTRWVRRAVFVDPERPRRREHRRVGLGPSSRRRATVLRRACGRRPRGRAPATSCARHAVAGLLLWADGLSPGARSSPPATSAPASSSAGRWPSSRPSPSRSPTSTSPPAP